jgi:S-adenosylmethionine:tRNA ribosyltransferase-isomerase
MKEETLQTLPWPDSRDEREIAPALRLSTYYYELPPSLIAQHPAQRRDGSRLLAIKRSTGRIRHCWFTDLPQLLRRSDLLVINETKVVPAALVGHKPSGGRVDLLVLDPVSEREDAAVKSWCERVCMVRSSKPLRPGSAILVDNGPILRVQKVLAPGRAVIRFPVEGGDLLSFLDTHGRTPLPRYIRGGLGEISDKERYQTVYARVAGSVAAPTAGLHFTESLLEDLRRTGIQTVRILLHVGPGTFAPVRGSDIRRHTMESELCVISEQAASHLTTARKEGRRIIAVGTTTVRALESAISSSGGFSAGQWWTDLFIFPGHEFKAVDGLVTNFHLPGSTLLMLVCAFAGIERVMEAYHSAIKKRYRFYSYGDACLML